MSCDVCVNLQKKKLLPFFDNAYQVSTLAPAHTYGVWKMVKHPEGLPVLPFACHGQGYATGSLVEDAYPVRLFADLGLEFFVACSFAKNMGLYGERIGALHACCASADDAVRLKSQLKVQWVGL